MIVRDETDQLRQYTLAKQEVAEVIRALKTFLHTRGRPDAADKCQELLVKLAEDRFNLAVVGQFKRGKSSLMNAVIGRDLLPTGRLPLTSAITTLCYGPQERAVLRRKGWVLDQEIPLSELAEYVTEQGNPGNQKGLLEARVELPVRFLRRGLYFIDTPGVGSARRENSQTTYTFLPEADAVIFVTSVEAPLSEAEESFLQDIRQYVRKLFVVVNKMDLLAPGERGQVLGYVHAGIERALGADQVRLYPLSARQALEAKLSADPVEIGQSGVEQLEAALALFLSTEKEQAFLVATLDRALRLLQEAGRHEPETDADDSLGSLRGRMISLHARLLSGQSAVPTPVSSEASNAKGFIEQAVTTRPTQPQPGGRRLSLRSRTCPICAAQSQALFDFFVDAQYALSETDQARRAFAQEHGLCRAHTWQFQQVASPQGISEGYAPLVEAVASELRRSLDQPAGEIVARIETLLAKNCPACHVLKEAGQASLKQFLEQIAAPEGQELYEESQGLCLPHLRAALAALPSRVTVEFLLREQVRRLEEVSEDMRSYMLKRDALRRGLHNQDEETAWRRALVQLAGEQSVSASCN